MIHSRNELRTIKTCSKNTRKKLDEKFLKSAAPDGKSIRYIIVNIKVDLK